MRRGKQSSLKGANLIELNPHPFDASTSQLLGSLYFIKAFLFVAHGMRNDDRGVLIHRMTLSAFSAAICVAL